MINQVIFIKSHLKTSSLSAETWPQVFDDSVARRDWGWRHELGVEELADIMIDGLRPVYAKEKEEREKREAN